MITRTYINEHGLPVLRRLLNGCKVHFGKELSAAAVIITCRDADNRLQEARFETGQRWTTLDGKKVLLPFPPSVKAERMQRKKRLIADARNLLTPLMHTACSGNAKRYIAGLLGEALVQEGNFAAALDWLSLGQPGPHNRVRLNLEEAKTALAVFATQACNGKPLSCASVAQLVSEVEELVRTQKAADEWRPDRSDYYKGIVPTEEYVRIHVTKAEEKNQRIVKARTALALLVAQDLDTQQVKHINGLMGATFLFEEDYENALLWLSKADADTDWPCRLNRDKAMLKIAEQSARTARR